MKRIFLLLILLLVSVRNIYAQTPEPSLWCLDFGLHAFGYSDNWIAEKQNPVFVEQMTASYGLGLPSQIAPYANLKYRVNEKFSVSLGAQVDYRNIDFSRQKIYSIWPGGVYHVRSSHNLFLSLPLAVDYYFRPGKHWEVSAGLGWMPSFLVFQKLVDVSNPRNYPIRSTIYQHYIQLQATFRYKLKENSPWALVISPTARYAVVDYYNTKKYDITYYPNIFHQRMLGLNIGLSHDLKWTRWKR